MNCMKKLFVFILLAFLFVFQGKAQNTGDYRSAVFNGYWASASSWERYDGSDWQAASSAPSNTDGVINILSGHNITINDSTYANEIIVHVGGTLTQESYLKHVLGSNNHFLTVNGHWIWNNGTIEGAGSVDIEATGNLDIGSSATRQLKINLTNNGTVNWTSGTIACFNSITNNNIFTINASGDVALDNFSAGGQQVFNNNGVFNKNAAGTLIAAVDEFNNTGTIACNGGIFRNESTLNNSANLIFGGAVLLNTATLNFNPGSVVSGTGVLNNEGDLRVNTDQTMPMGITLNQTSADIIFALDKTLTIEGTWNWNSGNVHLGGNVVIGASALLNMATSAQKIFINPATGHSFVLTNNGTIDWQAGNISWNSSNIYINNNNHFIISGNNNDGGTPIAMLNNQGTITKSSSGTTSFLKLNTLINAGTINCNSGTLSVDNQVINSGTLAFNGGTFQLTSTFDQNVGGQLSGTGTFLNYGGLFNINTNQDWPAGITCIQQGDVNIQSGITVTTHGNYTMNSGSISGPGTWQIAAGAQFNLESFLSKTFKSNLIVNNLGNLNWKNGNIIWGNGIQTINNSGVFNIGEVNSNLDLDAISNPGTAIINNNNQIIKYTYTTSNFGGVTLNNAAGKTIRGIGTINIGNFNNDGILEIGHPIGSMRNNGGQPLSVNSVLKIDLNGAGQGTGYDYLIRPSLVLAGSLNVTQTGALSNGTYRIIDAPGLSGSFSTVQLPEFCSLQVSADAVDIIRNGPELGDFRTKQNGDWSFITTWEQFNGYNWVPSGIPDESAGVITISHDITVNTAGIVGADQIVITGAGSLIINSRFFLRDGPGDDLLNTSGDGITINDGGRLSGTGTVNNQGRADVYGAGVIAVPFINNGSFYFTHATQGCCPGGFLNFTDGLTTGRFDNYDAFFIFATPGISQMNIVNGEFYNHTGAQFQANYKTNFDVSKFTNDGEFIVGVTGVSSAVCTIKSDQSSTHSGGRFKSNGNSMQFVMQTNGTFTYAADCVIDANMHYSTGTHEIYSTSYGAYDTRVSTTVNCRGSEMNFPGNVFVEAGIFGGPAIKKVGGTLFWWAGTISGGNLVINDTASAQFGAGQTTLGTLATTLVNNGSINIFNYHGGCCSGPSLNMTNGTIENNGQFIFTPTGGGGIYNVTLSGGTFNNNAGGTLINNATAVSPWGDNESYLRNTVFTNNGTILANGVSLNIFPTTSPVINGTVTVAAGGQVKLGIPSTTTTISSSAVINGAGTVYFFEGNHQVNTASYQVAGTSIGQTFSAANVYFNAPSVALNYVYMTSGVLGGAATKLIKDDMVFISGQITGGPISNTDTSVIHYGAGNTNLGAMNTAFTNNGVVEVSPYHPGCCSYPVINLAGGSITNNGTFNVTGSGGIRYVGISNGTFTNNAGAVINSNVGDVAFGEPSFRMQPADFTNNGTINVLRNIMELGNFTVGGEINVSPNTVLRSTGTITFNGSLINNNGNITAPFDFINAAAKTLKGNGTFSSNFVLNNAATVAPGSSPGILTVAGNYTQGDATLNIEISGTSPGTGYDRLAVTGTAAISGTLNATELPGFDAQGVTTLDIITAGSVTGTFSQVNLPPLWSVHYASNKVSLIKFFQFVYCRDADNDGFGNPADTIRRVETIAPAGYTADSTDCNDANAAVNPAATEICDGIDNDCDGNVDMVYMPGLIMYLPLNGNANDVSGNDLNGTINGTVTAVADRLGNANGAMRFPGSSNSHISIPDQPLLRPSGITLGAWVKINSQTSLSGFISKSINCYNDSWHFGSQDGNYSTWVSNSTSCGDFVQMTSPLTVGTWNYVVFTLDDVADTRKMYVNGTLVATGSYTSSIPYDGNPVLIGAAIENGSLAFPLNGDLDDVVIFNRAITAGEVSTLFNNSNPIVALNATYFADADGDGFGNPAVSQVACSQPSGYVLNNTDCNDNSAAAYPGATEICDGIDNNCDGQIDVAILTTGLVAYYPFSGNANDAVGSLNGIVNGASLATDRFGNASSAYSFDGVNDFINTSNVALTQTDNWTMTAWVKPAASSPDVIVVQNGGDGGGAPCNGYSMGLNNLNVTGYHPCVAFLNGGSAAPQVNQWIHLTMVRQSGVTSFYLNGVQAPNTFTSAPITPAGVITIGSASGIRFFNGSIDDVKIYNIALTPAQILQDFNVAPLSQTYYVDVDGDGFGNPAVSQVACSQPAGYVLNNTDCDDTRSSVYPGAPEICDGIDNDCDGYIDAIVTTGIVCGMATSEGQSFSLTAPPGKVFTSVDFASYGTPNGSCGNFTLGSCHAASTQAIVEGLVIGQNSVTLTQNYQIFGDPCVGVYKRFYVQARYTNIEPLAQTYYADADGDGFGNPAVTTTVSCGSTAPTGYVSDNTDCDDANSNIYPGVQAGTVNGTTNLCIGATATYTSSGQTGGTWSTGNADVATVDPGTGLVTAIGAGTTSITYTIASCNGPLSSSQSIIVISTPVVNAVNDLSVANGSSTGIINFTGTATGYQWTNNTPSIALAASGTGQVPSFTAINSGITPVIATITVTPFNTVNGTTCSGSPVIFTITVTPTAIFTMNAVPDQVVCAQTLTSPVVFSSSTPGVTYSWTNSEPSISLVASGTGDIPSFLAQNSGITDITATITVTPSVSDGNGGSINGVPVSFTIRVNHRPQMTAINNIQACRESTVDPVIFTGAATSFNWTNDNTGIGLAANGSGNTPSFTATNIFLTNSMIANILVTPSTNDGVFCAGSSESFTITVHPKPVMSNVSDRVFCNGNIASVVFSGVAVTEYNWVSSNTLFGINPFGTGNLGPAAVGFNTNVPVITSFTVTPRYINNFFTCLGDPKSFTITVNPTPSLDAVADQRLCVGQSTTDINFSSNVTGATFNWTNSIPAIGLPAAGSGNIPSFTTTGSGNSNVVARAEANGCLGGIRNFSIIVDPVPVIAPINDVTVCNGTTLNNILIGSPSFSWTNSNPGIGLPASGSGVGMLPAFTAFNNGITPVSATITVTGNSNNPGCFSAPVSFQITVNPSPSLDPVEHQFFCNENPTSVIAFSGQVPGTIYNWTNNNTSIGLAGSGTGNIPSFTPSTTSINPVDATVFVVPAYTNNGVTCTSGGRDFTITIKPLPIVNDIADKIVCNGVTTGVSFTSFNGLANYFTWTNNNPSIGIPASGTGNIPDFTAVNNGTTPIVATITVTPFRNLVNNIDCEGLSKTFTITVNPTPTVSGIANQSYCNGSTTNEIVLSGTVPGTNFIWTNSNPGIGLAASGTGNIPSFNATNNSSFASTASILVSPQISAGIITCAGPQVSFLINIRPTITPVVTASGPLVFCSSSSVTLTSDQPTGNLWSNGATTNSIIVNSSGTYTVTNTDPFGCSSLPSNPITVTVTSLLTPSVTISTAATTICRSTSVTFNAVVTNLGSSLIYAWKKNGITVSTNSSYATSTLLNGETITCQVVGANPCSAAASSATSNPIQMTVLPVVNAGTISGLTSLAQGFNYTYSSNGNPGGAWSSSNTSVLTIDPVTGICTTVSPGVATITYTLLTGCGAPRSASKQVQVVNITTPIVGSDHVCPQSTAISYSLAPTVPSGGTWNISNPSLASIIVEPGNDRIILFTPLMTGIVTISYTLPGNIVVSKDVEIMNAPLTGPITGPGNLCEFYGTNGTFTFTRETTNPVTGYQWTLPSSLTLIGGQGTNNLMVRLSASYVPNQIYQLVATPIGLNCPAAAASLILTSAAPQTPAPITASTSNICPLIGTNVPATFTIPKVAGAASYIWLAPPGTTITHPNGLGLNDTTITMTFSNAYATGAITVRAVNGCGASSTRSLTVARTSPSAPGLISGPTSICRNINPGAIPATYVVAQLAGVVSYNWSVPAGAIGLTGQGTNTISFIYPEGFNGGSISVVAVNGCGTSVARSLSVSRLNPSTPGVIDVVNINTCPNREFTYTIASMPANATSVIWTAPGTIVSGQGTTSIRVSYPATTVNGTVTATAVNNCASSVTRSVVVKLPNCPPFLTRGETNTDTKATASQEMKKDFTKAVKQELDVQVMTNPTHSEFTLVIKSSSNEPVSMRIIDINSRVKEVRTAILPGQPVKAGMHYFNGIYFAEFVQGREKKVIKLVKL